MDIIAIILGLALTAFIVVSILLLLYRAEKRRKAETKYVDRWQVDIQTNVSKDLTKDQKRKTNDKFRNSEMECLFIYLTILKKTREKNTFEQDTKTKDEGVGHTTERGSKLSVPLRKICKH